MDEVFFLKKKKKEWDSLHGRLNSHYEAWNTRKRSTKILQHTGNQRKAFYRQRIPESSCARKETVDKDPLVTSRNGDRKIMESIRITVVK